MEVEGNSRACREVQHFAPLDGLRGVAILAIILTHSFAQGGDSSFAHLLTTVANTAWVGVTLFFCLSGFLISGILIDMKGTRNWYMHFFIRRSLRIFPLYFMFVALCLFILPQWDWAASHLPHYGAVTQICYWVYLGNMTEFVTGLKPENTPLSPLWSLSVEEQIYLIWPIIVALTPRRNLDKAFIAFFAFSAIWKIGAYVLAKSVQLRYGWTFSCMDAFAAGGLVAVWSRDVDKMRRVMTYAPIVFQNSTFFLLGMIIGQRHFNFSLNLGPMLTLGTSMLAVNFAALIGTIVTSSQGCSLNIFLSQPWLCWCGRYSYGAYIFHELIIELMRPLFGGWDGIRYRWPSISQSLLFSPSIFVSTFAVAWVSWHLWERHFLLLKRFVPGSSQVVRPTFMSESGK